MGRLKAYAVTSTTRIESLPDVPTTQEAGAAQLNLWKKLATDRQLN